MKIIVNEEFLAAFDQLLNAARNLTKALPSRVTEDAKVLEDAVRVAQRAMLTCGAVLDDPQKEEEE